MVLLEPEQRVREQKVSDLVAAVVENERAPVLMFPLTRIGVLVESRPVEPRQTVFVLRKVPGHPIENQPEPRLVTRIDEVFEILRRPEAARRGKEPQDLIAPGTGERMLHHRQQL